MQTQTQPLEAPASFPGLADRGDYLFDAHVNELRAAEHQIQRLKDDLEALREERQTIEALVPSHVRERLELMPYAAALLTHSWTLRALQIYQNLRWTAWRFLQGRGQTPPQEASPDEPSTSQGRLVAPRAIFIDVTAAYNGAVGGGIQRVCFSISRTLRQADCVVVVRRHGAFWEFVDGKLLGRVRDVADGDVYLILDAFWDEVDDLRALFDRARAVGAKTVLCIHDAIPLLHPALIVESWAIHFADSLTVLLPSTDLIISVSQTSAREIATVLKRFDAHVPVSWFHLGCDAFPDVLPSEDIPRERCFVSLGTLEPKKGYECVIDAFEQVWARGTPVQYRIIGGRGWLCDALVARIENHPEYGRRLFWSQTASDVEVAKLLKNAYCFVQASLVEGFGLPLVEAAARNLPVIASDIPVFREIAGDSVCFFPVCDSAALAAEIEKALHQRPAGARTRAPTWCEAGQELIEAVRGTPRLST